MTAGSKSRHFDRVLSVPAPTSNPTTTTPILPQLCQSTGCSTYPSRVGRAASFDPERRGGARRRAEHGGRCLRAATRPKASSAPASETAPGSPTSSRSSCFAWHEEDPGAPAPYQSPEPDRGPLPLRRSPLAGGQSSVSAGVRRVPRRTHSSRDCPTFKPFLIAPGHEFSPGMHEHRRASGSGTATPREIPGCVLRSRLMSQRRGASGALRNGLSSCRARKPRSISAPACCSTRGIRRGSRSLDTPADGPPCSARAHASSRFPWMRKDSMSPRGRRVARALASPTSRRRASSRLVRRCRSSVASCCSTGPSAPVLSWWRTTTTASTDTGGGRLPPCRASTQTAVWPTSGLSRRPCFRHCGWATSSRPTDWRQPSRTRSETPATRCRSRCRARSPSSSKRAPLRPSRAPDASHIRQASGAPLCPGPGTLAGRARTRPVRSRHAGCGLVRQESG